MKSVRARYEHGSLTPEEPVALHEGERVRVIVLRQADPRRWDLVRLAATGDDDAALAAAGLADWADALDREDAG